MDGITRSSWDIYKTRINIKQETMVEVTIRWQFKYAFAKLSKFLLKNLGCGSVW